MVIGSSIPLDPEHAEAISELTGCTCELDEQRLWRPGLVQPIRASGAEQGVGSRNRIPLQDLRISLTSLGQTEYAVGDVHATGFHRRTAHETHAYLHPSVLKDAAEHGDSAMVEGCLVEKVRCLIHGFLLG
jgi:hypothetical protein